MSATPRSIIRRCASSRLPMITTSPGPIPLSGKSAAIAKTQTRPATAWSSPAICWPLTAAAIALIFVGVSTSDEASRDSRM
jgi:hypothetical protein